MLWSTFLLQIFSHICYCFKDSIISSGLLKRFLTKTFEEEMLIRRWTTPLLQILCEFLLYAQVIFKSIRVPDGTFQSTSECEWVKACSDGKVSYYLHDLLVVNPPSTSRPQVGEHGPPELGRKRGLAGRAPLTPNVQDTPVKWYWEHFIG